jgi:hypothetical protein
MQDMRRLLLTCLTLMALNTHAGVIENTSREISRGITDGAVQSTTKAFEQIQKDSERRAKEYAADNKRKQRLASISGCATNAKKTSCKCFDKQGGIENILDEKQCMDVVNRGLAAINDL